MIETVIQIKRTALYQKHVAAGAKMVSFAGYEMPIQYKGITHEHRAVRQKVGLFDVSHMGEYFVDGNDAVSFLQKVTTNNVASLDVGKIQYSCMTMTNGGIVDDLLVYRLKDGFMLVVNAANIDKDLKWLRSHLTGDVRIANRSDELSLLALQGPFAQRVMAELTSHDLENMEYYTSAETRIAGVELIFSRTGYTGEDGFEMYFSNDSAEAVWTAVTKAGGKYDLELVGLGARDSLRLEMKMALYGNDIDESTSPIEAGLSWIVDFDKEFIGRDILLQQKKEKPRRRLVCLEMDDRAIPRSGYGIYDGADSIGRVTSGMFSPSLKKPIALGYVPTARSKSGSTLQIAIRDKKLQAVVVKPPFYKQGSHR